MKISSASGSALSPSRATRPLTLTRPSSIIFSATRRDAAPRADKALLQITIHEGRNRQVRRMCEAAGMHVTRLKRIAEGPIALGDLPLGAWRYLADEEITHLKTGK